MDWFGPNSARLCPARADRMCIFAKSMAPSALANWFRFFSSGSFHSVHRCPLHPVRSDLRNTPPIFCPCAFSLGNKFWFGLGAAMLVATYDYWGAYNVCFLGGELKDPGRTIPRAVLLSILLVAGLYLLMNLSVLGVIDWRGVI